MEKNIIIGFFVLFLVVSVIGLILYHTTVEPLKDSLLKFILEEITLTLAFGASLLYFVAILYYMINPQKVSSKIIFFAIIIGIWIIASPYFLFIE